MVKSVSRYPKTSHLAKFAASHAVGSYAPYLSAGYQGGKLAYSAYKSLSSMRKGGNRPPKTPVKSKQIHDNGNEGHTITKSYSKTPRKKLSKAEIALRDALPQVFRRTANTPITSAIGQQTFNGVGDIFWTFSDLDAFASSSAINTKRFWVDTASCRVLLTNFTTAPVQIRIYQVSTKDDCSETPDTRVSTGLDMKYGVANTSKTPFMSPYESLNFTKAYKIDTSTDVTLSPGECHNYNAHWNIQKYYVSSQQATDPGIYKKGFTKHIMIRLMGTPVSNGTTTTLGAAKVGIMTFTCLKYKVPQGSTQNQLIATQFNVPPTAISVQNTVNEDTGAAQVVTTL